MQLLHLLWPTLEIKLHIKKTASLFKGKYSVNKAKLDKTLRVLCGICYELYIVDCAHLQYITMTSEWVRWRLKSAESRLFTEAFIQVQIKENIKAPRYWPLCGEFTGDRGITRTNGQWLGLYVPRKDTFCYRFCQALSDKRYYQKHIPGENGKMAVFGMAAKKIQTFGGHENWRKS